MESLRLVNIGNSCYINAALQLLFSIQEFKEFIRKRHFHVPYMRQDICNELFYLFSNSQQLNSACTLRALVANFTNNVYFNDSSMQDSEEFLTTLLQVIRQEVTVSNVAGQALINDFCGIENNVRRFVSRGGTCPNCQSLPRTEEERFNVINIQLPNIQTNQTLQLSSLLANHFSSSSNTVRMKCSQCCKCTRNCPQSGLCQLRDSVSQTVLVHSPDTLLIKINRFGIHGMKNQTHVWPEDTIMLGGEYFSLKSVVDHLGSTVNSGHYICHVKSGQLWTRCNDSEVIRGQEELQAKSKDNYYYLYSKVIRPRSTIVLTGDWQCVKGRMAPGGAHIQLDQRTGKNYARDPNLPSSGSQFMSSFQTTTISPPPGFGLTTGSGLGPLSHPTGTHEVYSHVIIPSLINRGFRNFNDWNSNQSNLYIGRDNHYVPGVIGSKWQNPFQVKKYGLDKCLILYEKGSEMILI